MRWVLDFAYLVAVTVTSPIWLSRMLRTGKIRTDWPARLGRGATIARTSRPRVLLHAVSVGEVNALRLLVEQLAASPARPEIVIATTTDTGFARATGLFGTAHHVVRYPFDFSWAVARLLDRIAPDVVGLVELEVWPNFTAACRRRRIPVGVINGRLTARSARRYARIRTLVRPSFARLAFVAAQNDEYAARFAALGATPAHVTVVGTMKWDTARIADDVAGAEALRADLGIDPARPLIVAGSTAPDEHALLHASTPEGVQLLCAPRKPEWFDAAAAELPGCVRRSTGDGDARSDRFLLDTIGELRAAYALAHVVVIGRSFGTLHGSDMMEPVALGRATVVGPAVTDFRDVVEALVTGDGLVQTDGTALGETIQSLLDDAPRRRTLAANGREVIRAQQGATARCCQLLLAHLPATRTPDDGADHRSRTDLETSP